MSIDVLNEQRRAAAEASGGISTGAIYSAFERTVARRDLRGDLLDFGAGVGNLTRCMDRLGRFASIAAIDILPCPPALPAGVRWFSWDLNEPTKLDAASFDVVVSAEVIEHLENPRAVAREWFRLLRPGGTLVFSTPNTESWRSLLALLLRGHFVDFGENSYPAHITALVRKDMERIVAEAGFVFQEFVYTDEGSIPKFPAVKWQKAVGGFLKGMRFSDNVLAVARKP